MKRLFITGLLSLVLLPQLGWATVGNYTNNGDITFPLAIDATNVYNNGSFDFRQNPTVRPFDTSNTRNFINNGIMIGAVGFQFDNAPSTGTRKFAASFRNRLAGRITALDTPGALSQINGVPFDTTLIFPSYLLVSATNIINEGVLSAGAGGLMRLVGTNVDLSRSGLEIQPIDPQGSLNGFATNYFIPEVAIYDFYAGQTNQVINSGNIIQNGGGLIVSPASRVQYTFVRRPNDPLRVNPKQIRVVPSVWDFYTNTPAFTNLTITNFDGSISFTNVPLTNIVQTVFVGLPATGEVDGEVRFFDSDDFRNPFKTVSVRVTLTSTNVVSISPELSSIYLVDTLASATNRSFYTNFTDISEQRPQNYLLERAEPFEFFFGFSGNAPFSPDLLYKTNFVTRTVTNDYAAYSAFVDNIASRPPNIPEGTVTNLPGRIEVLADVLDMSRARFRADGLLNIQAKHLTANSSNAVVDCENLSYTLGSTNGNLKIQGLAQESVSRFQGYPFVWSGLWTNQENQLIENWTPDPADTNVPPIIFIPANITNIVEVRLYAMILDAASMLTQVPVVVNAMVTHSTNVVINDNMTVVQSFFVDGQSFTLNGSITFSNTFFTDTRGNTVVISLESWIGTNAPNLKFFTNTGTLRIPSEAHFGDDRPTPYTAFVNRGTIDAYGQTIQSEYCEISGFNLASGDLAIVTRSGKVEGGTLTSGGDVRLFAGDLKFNRATIRTGSRLDLSVTNSLFDAGGGSDNAFSSSDGFRLFIKPQAGDLLGTTFETVAPFNAEVDHIWAATDRGPTKAGFLNNTALGTLLLTPGDFEAQFPPLFFFAGTGVSNALYVDVLDLSQLIDYQNELVINPDLVIYFAAARLAVTPPLTNGASQQPEEYLDGQFDGRLRWVKEFAGPGSSVPVVINGVSVLVNRALRFSRIIDSDGDGTPNFFDVTPFDGLEFILSGSLSQTPPPSAKVFLISWEAAPNTIYQVEFATNALLGNWQPLEKYTNHTATSKTVTIWDTNGPAGAIQRFYRVGYAP